MVETLLADAWVWNRGDQILGKLIAGFIVNCLQGGFSPSSGLPAAFPSPLFSPSPSFSKLSCGLQSPRGLDGPPLAFPSPSLSSLSPPSLSFSLTLFLLVL